MATPLPGTDHSSAKPEQSALLSFFLRVKSWLESPSDILTICYVLLGLYALPLIVLLATFIASDWYTRSSPTITFSMAIAGLYASDVRETLGTFVVPFIMAYAVAGVQKDGRIEARTIWLFATLTFLFLLSIVVYCAITTRVDVMLGQTDALPEVVSKSREHFLAMSRDYVKELLVYISLLIGISQAGRQGEQK
ncbi:hypothetical protein [Luteimonas kalidii]|uniref:Uncharacterized protein n=1 Tax=Luteimonas kalidii TaxID=3042025 RepID=A0ABT6JRT3_9GAMM|nr:hypothetical protein [Luteimonas kalidii]MDH5833396.1 hypothetical protein [Luteimonas kalidii]